jgi:polyphosphate kinase 2 (PPK2 family)
VEPVLGFCTQDQYRRFLQQVPIFEDLLLDDGIQLIKLWFSIDRETQAERLEARRSDVRRQWKLSPVDGLAQERWDEVTRYKLDMYSATHTDRSPWVIVQGADKFRARVEAMRYVLHALGAEPLDPEMRLKPDPAVIRRYDPEDP